MKPGDYTLLAEEYSKHRPDYSKQALLELMRHTGARQEDFKVADVGAGTGKWTYMLAKEGLNCIAVEPNDAMREQGIVYTSGLNNVRWMA